MITSMQIIFKWIMKKGSTENGLPLKDHYQTQFKISTKWFGKGQQPKPIHTFQHSSSEKSKLKFNFSETELIIMVTQVVERGRRKCDQYWDSEEKQFGNLKVKMTSEDVTLRKNGIIERTLSLSSLSGDETREGMTYISSKI